MKKIHLLFILQFLIVQGIFSQQIALKKGVILEGLSIHDSIPETFSLYLPTTFNADRKWPLLMVFDLNGEEKRTLSMFLQAAEQEGYLLAAPHISDTVSLSANMVSTGKTIEHIANLLPVQQNRIYTAGANSGARFSNLVPIFIKNVSGAISIAATIANTDLLNVKQPFHFVGIVGKNNFEYTSMLAVEKILDRFKFPNQILLHEKEGAWPDLEYLKKSLQLLTLGAMAKGVVPKDSTYVESAFNEDVKKVNGLIQRRKLLLAEQYLGEMTSIYGAHRNLDSLRAVLKDLRRDKLYRAMRRGENNAFLKESLLKEDYQYYMEEDILSHNFNNLGWWNFQMQELEKFISGTDIYEKQMGNRLQNFVNALAVDNINIELSEPIIDEDALAFLYMLKTVLEPENFDYYLNIISLSSKNEDFGTALFYLEEALKKGFKDTDKLYNLEDTALFRITPEFNKVVSKYLKDARYDIIEE
ncbi:alpha/beta hydrolase [Muricauda sp. JGD-17]|uniref:Alpha/beta hydrolase n=1 Tax=Flagellimonas ochracea TaxID=2696472 RepID=A0A964T8Q8_9FLAO|nr:alpha/beta hydrolase [Allomuricauda ochracea]NAY90315.1 alpha/beta hydrolase [Allomuricauda ochracea]